MLSNLACAAENRVNLQDDDNQFEDSRSYKTAQDVLNQQRQSQSEKSRKSNFADSVEITMDACLAQHYYTLGIRICQAEAYKSYDKVLNDVYNHAIKSLDAKTANSLRLAQRKWLEFRKAEGLARGDYTSAEFRGTIVGIAIGLQDIAAIKQRISELMFYLGEDQN